MNKIYKVIYSETRKAWVVVSELVTGHKKSSGRRAMRLALAASVAAAAVMLPARDAGAFSSSYVPNYSSSSGYGAQDYLTDGGHVDVSQIGGYNQQHGTYYSYVYVDNDGTVNFYKNENYQRNDISSMIGNVAIGNFAQAGSAADAKMVNFNLYNGNNTYVAYETKPEGATGNWNSTTGPNGKTYWYPSSYSDRTYAYTPTYNSGGTVIEKDGKYYQSRQDFVPELDDQGNWQYDTNGNPIGKTVFKYAEIGEKIWKKDPNNPSGNLIVDYKKVDENGNPVFDLTAADIGMDDSNPYAYSGGTNNVAVGNKSKTTSHSSVAVGDTSTARGWRSVAIGAQAEAGQENAGGDWNNGTSAVAIGDSAKAYGGTSVALGSHAQTWSFSGIAVGNGSNAGTEYGIAIGDGANIAYINGADKIEQQRTAAQSIAIGRDALAQAKDVTAVGRNAQGMMRNATAYGNNSHANGWNSIAIGNKATAGLQSEILNEDGTAKDGAIANSAIAVGNRARATAEYTTAIGAGTNAEGWHAVAVGDSNQATGRFSTAIGAGWSINHTEGEPDNDDATDGSDAINTEGTRTYESIGANQAGGDYSTAAGYGNKTTGTQSSAFGKENEVSGLSSLGVGAGNKVGTVKIGENGILAVSTDQAQTVSGYAVGSYNTITGNEGSNAGAFGASNTVSGDNSYVIGNSSTTETDAKGSFVLGNNASAKVSGAVALGTDSVAARDKANGGAGAGYDVTTNTNYAGEGANSPTWLSTHGAISVGGSANDTDAKIGTAATQTRQITGVAAGTADTDAVNVAQLRLAIDAFSGEGGGAPIATDNRAVGLRVENNQQKIISPFIEIQGVKDATADANENSEYAQADAERAIAIGYKSDAQGTDSIVIGSGAEAYGEQTIAIGHKAKAGDAGDSSKAKGAVAISANSQSTGEYSVAMQGSKATGDYSIAYGKDSQANTENSLAALGGTVKEDGKGSAAIGEGAQATVAGTVALGKGSIADQKSGKDQGNSGYDVLLDGESEEEDYIWRSTENAIAVGSVNGKITRRIIGVAAGHDDTDAVNVAQLKKVAEALKDSGGGSGSWNLAVNDKDPDPVKNDNTVRLNVNQPEGTELLNLTNEVNDNGERVVTWVVSDSPKFDSLTVGTKGGTFTSKGPAVFEGPVTMKENLNMSGKQIKNLGWATEDDDAVPLGQLKDYVNNTGNNFNYINNKIDKGLRHVGSRAAALAALHPLDYDPDKPTSIMAGFGHYKGDSTVALGVAHHFNDDTLVTVGSTIGHDPMVNVGLSLRLGRNTNMTEKRWKVQRYTAVDYDAKLKVMEAKYRDLKEDKDAEISALRRELQSLREDMRTLRGTKGTRK